MSTAPVDPRFWRVHPRFGVAGGPLVHALSDEGMERAFGVGANVRPGVTTQALMALAVLGGEAALVEVHGSRVTATPLGQRYDQVAWGYLRSRGLVEAADERGNSIRLTPRGRDAVDRGHAEQESLLGRVRRAHPISDEDRVRWQVPSEERQAGAAA